MKYYTVLFVVLLLICAALCVGCDKNFLADSDNTAQTESETTALESKSKIAYTDTQSPVYRGGKVESIDTASEILGISFPSSSEIKWSYTFVTQLIDDVANFKYKPNYIVCDISVPLDKKDELLNKLRSSMHEAPREEITGWSYIAECGDLYLMKQNVMIFTMDMTLVMIAE